MLASAAAAISVVIGQEIEISPPDVRIIDDTDAATEFYGTAPYACSTSFTIAGEPCRLVQLVPERVRRADGAGDRRDRAWSRATVADYSGAARLGDGERDHRQRADHRDSSPTSTFASGRSSDAHSSRSGTRSSSRSERSSTSTARPTRPSTCSSTDCASAHGHLLVTEDGEWAIEVQSLSTSPSCASRRWLAAPASSRTKTPMKGTI